jgi:phage shock protein C
MTAKKRLVRSTTDTKLGGVCAGIADYLETDPTVIRVVWLVLSFFTGVFPGIILYMILWVVMPEGEAQPPEEFD